MRFPSAWDAYKFGTGFLKTHYSDSETIIHSWDESRYDAENIFDVGQSPVLQLSVHPGEFHHSGYMGQSGWSVDGTFLVNRAEALSLGNTGIPEGFIPGEDEEGLWIKCTKTSEQLDQELEEYMRQGVIEAEIKKQEEQDDMNKVSAEFFPTRGAASRFKVSLTDIMSMGREAFLKSAVPASHN